MKYVFVDESKSHAKTNFTGEITSRTTMQRNAYDECYEVGSGRITSGHAPTPRPTSPRVPGHISQIFLTS
jgi:hypothetical protein